MDKFTEKGVIEIAEEYVKQDSRDIEIMMVKGFELLIKFIFSTHNWIFMKLVECVCN
jgi:hypothetical protein